MWARMNWLDRYQAHGMRVQLPQTLRIRDSFEGSQVRDRELVQSDVGCVTTTHSSVL